MTKTLDSIIRDVCHNFENPRRDSFQAQIDAKQDLLQWVADEVIGGMETRKHPSGNTHKRRIQNRNAFRAEKLELLRKKGWKDGSDE